MAMNSIDSIDSIDTNSKLKQHMNKFTLPQFLFCRIQKPCNNIQCHQVNKTLTTRLENIKRYRRNN